MKRQRVWICHGFWKAQFLPRIIGLVIGVVTVQVWAEEKAENLWPAPVKNWTPVRAGEHPRLFFRRSDLPALKKRADTSEGRAIIQRLRFLLNGSDGESMPTVFNHSGKAYEAKTKEPPAGQTYTLWHGSGYGMLYQLTGEKKYAELGKQCVAKAFEGQRDRDDRYSWVAPGGALRAGPSIGAIAMAYDLCYDGWGEDFRQKVALELQNYDQGSHMRLPELARGQRHGPQSNHWGPQIGGAALALLATRGDPGVDDAKIARLLEDNVKCFKRSLTEGFGDGGYFHEHAGPGQISSDTAFVPALQAWKIAGGLDFITPRPNAPAITLIRCYELTRINERTVYALRHPSSYGSGVYPEDRNGLSRGGQFAQGFGAILEQQRPAVLWVYNHLVEPDPKARTFDTVSPYPHRAVLALINWPIGVEPKNPAEVLPRILHDSVQHYFAFRNHWQDESDIVVTGLFGARNDGAEPIMVSGMGERLSWGVCPKVRKSQLTETRPDGSGTLRAGDTFLAVDFSRASGAELLLAMTGPGAPMAKQAESVLEALPTANDLKAAARAEALRSSPDGGAPVRKFEPGRTPTQWIYAGPFKTKGNTAGAEDLLKPLGGRARATPQVGTEVTYGGESIPFKPLPARYVVQTRRRPGIGEGKDLIPDHMVSVLDAIGRSFESTSFFYTVLDNDKERVVRLHAGHPDQSVWVGGQAVKDGGLIILPVGFVPVMLEFNIGKRTLVETVVRFEDAEQLAAIAAARAIESEKEQKAAAARLEKDGENRIASGRPNAKTTTVKAGGHSLAVMTFQKGSAPEVQVREDKVWIGNQSLWFDGERIVLEPQSPK